MNKTRQSKLESAKIARAYMAGGTPPYQAARKCGFMRVALMEDAIHELEKQEHIDQQLAIVGQPEPAQDDSSSAYLPSASTVLDTKAPTEPAPETKPVIYKPLKVWRNKAASISYYGQNGDHEPIYRLSIEGRTMFLNIPAADVSDVVSLLCEAAGLNGPESSDGPSKQELAMMNDDLTRRNIDLCIQLDELKKRPDAQVIDEMKAELEAEKAAHVALKLKVFDKLLALV